eukprot:5556984-Alexandrium_andersonii.AAC.1
MGWVAGRLSPGKSQGSERAGGWAGRRTDRMVVGWAPPPICPACSAFTWHLAVATSGLDQGLKTARSSWSFAVPCSA